MLNMDLSINIVTVFYLLLVPVLFVSLQVLKKLLPFVDTQRRQWLQWLDILVWALYFILFINHLWRHNLLLAIVVALLFLMLIFWYTHFGLKNYIAGLIVRQENRFSKNDILILPDGTEGTIVEFNRQSVTLETTNGITMEIPYSELLNRLAKRKTATENISKQIITVDIPSNSDFRQWHNTLRNFILSLPWTPANKLPLIEITGRTNTTLTVQIILYSIDERYLNEMQNEVENFIKNK